MLSLMNPLWQQRERGAVPEPWESLQLSSASVSLAPGAAQPTQGRLHLLLRSFL